MIKNLACKAFLSVLILLSFAQLSATASQAENSGANAPALKGTNSGADTLSGVPDTLRSYLLVQEQLRNTQIAIEQSRQEAEAAAARNAELLEARLAVFEKSLASQRLDELKEMQTSNRMVLNAAGIFAAIAFIVLLFTALLHWSAVNRLATLASSLPSATPTLGPGEIPLLGKGALEQSTQRFLGTIERLEKRIHEMEETMKPQRSLPAAGSSNGHHEAATEAPAANPPGGHVVAGHLHEHGGAVDALLGKGETMLKLDQAEGALGCFEEALAIDPANAEALVRKGLALERLLRLEEALACYDRAIAADSSLTMAYLYKGGVFNRMERFSEALECYEKALKAQEKAPMSELVAS